MSDAKKKVKFPNPFANAREEVKVIYDFAVDGGLVSVINLLEAEGDLAIVDFYARGITELDSAGDGVTIDVGIVGGDTDILLDGAAEATFAAGALVQSTVVEGAPNVLPMPLKLASGGIIAMQIIGEALTSGKCEFHFGVVRF